MTSLAAKTVTGCVAGQLSDGSCADGAKVAAVMQGLSYVGDLARKDQIASSAKGVRIVDAQGNELNNLSGPSAGVNGDLIKLGGERLSIPKICLANQSLCEPSPSGQYTLKTEYFDAANNVLKLPDGLSLDSFKAVYAKKISPLGWLQGGAGGLFSKPYAPGSFADKVVESFAGPHDWLNAPHYYDANGMNLSTTLSGSEFWNYLNVLVAQPVGLSTLNDQTSILSIIRSGVNQTQRNLNK